MDWSKQHTNKKPEQTSLCCNLLKSNKKYIYFYCILVWSFIKRMNKLWIIFQSCCFTSERRTERTSGVTRCEPHKSLQGKMLRRVAAHCFKVTDGWQQRKTQASSWWDPGHLLWIYTHISETKHWLSCDLLSWRHVIMSLHVPLFVRQTCRCSQHPLVQFNSVYLSFISQYIVYQCSHNITDDSKTQMLRLVYYFTL